MAKTSQNRSKNITGRIVVSAITKLMKNTGWTARTITKYIKMQYGIDDRSLSRNVSRALKQGVGLGLLQCDRGRFRLTQMSGLVVPHVLPPTKKDQPQQQEHRQQPGRQQPGRKQRVASKPQPRRKQQPLRIKSSVNIISCEKDATTQQ